MLIRFNYKLHFRNCEKETKRGFIKIESDSVENADSTLFNKVYAKLDEKEKMNLVELETTSITVIR